MKLDRFRSPLRVLMGVLFILAGVMHFVRLQFYLNIMPPFLPYHLELVYISGVLEILGGFGVLIPSFRRFSGYGLIGLLIAVFPANIYMLTHNIEVVGFTQFTYMLILRLPLQLIFIAWVYWCTISKSIADLNHEDHEEHEVLLK